MNIQLFSSDGVSLIATIHGVIVDNTYVIVWAGMAFAYDSQDGKYKERPLYQHSGLYTIN